MKITIKDTQKISALQEEFNMAFPYLKIEFFSKHRKAVCESAKILLNHKTFGESRTVRSQKELTITPRMTVIELEQDFQDVYGLLIQVFRKSGKIWLETTVTDSWSLEEQNLQGEDLSKKGA